MGTCPAEALQDGSAARLFRRKKGTRPLHESRLPGLLRASGLILSEQRNVACEALSLLQDVSGLPGWRDDLTMGGALSELCSTELDVYSTQGLWTEFVTSSSSIVAMIGHECCVSFWLELAFIRCLAHFTYLTQPLTIRQQSCASEIDTIFFSLSPPKRGHETLFPLSLNTT